MWESSIAGSIRIAGAHRLPGELWLVVVLIVLAANGCKRSKPIVQGDPRLATNAARMYSLAVLPTFHLSISDDGVAALGNKPRKYVRGDFTYAGVAYKDVGIRFKGHRSMQSWDGKPAFKIRFDKFVPERRFLGLKKLTLNNMVEDPTMLREHLGFLVHRSAGVVAPRTGYARVYVNGEEYGLYLNIEQVDEMFLQHHVGTTDGHVYEGEYGCDLYPEDAPGFEREVGDDSIEILQRLTAFATGPVEKLFASDGPLNVPSVLSYLATSALLGDFDGYRHSHNYRIYHDPKTDKWTIIPWGLDRVFKRGLDIYDSGGLLARRCFSDAPCRLNYVRTMEGLVQTLESLKLEETIKDVITLTDRAARADPKKPYSLDRMEEKRNELRTFIRDRPSEVRGSLTCLQGDREVDRDGDGYGCDDCDDYNPQIHPRAVEVCDQVDNDCNGLVDDGSKCSCPKVIVDGAVFYFCNLPMTWSEASAFCKQRSSNLARIDSRDQSRQVFEEAKKIVKEKWWIGLSDRDAEDTFVWSDGSPVGFVRWSKGQPDNDACNQDCVALKADGGKWHDTHCASRLPFICRSTASGGPGANIAAPALESGQ